MISVTKADGSVQPFSEEKIRESIRRSHVPVELHDKALEHIKSIAFNGITTQEIYRHMNEFLGSNAPHAVALYSLKQAVMSLGPTGYPFEDFISYLLQAEGYTTSVRQILQGRCISHEIDVVAEKHTALPTKVMVEAKYHNEPGLMTDVHVPMYTKSRFDDVKEKYGFTKCLIVTNTKMTSDAIAFGQCVGIDLLAWQYPDGDGLREKIEKYKLIPITALPTLSVQAKQKLLEHDIVLCQQLCKDASILDQLQLPEDVKKSVMESSTYVCSLS